MKSKEVDKRVAASCVQARACLQVQDGGRLFGHRPGQETAQALTVQAAADMLQGSISDHFSIPFLEGSWSKSLLLNMCQLLAFRKAPAEAALAHLKADRSGGDPW